MRTLLYVILGLVAVVVAAVLALPYVVPQETLRATVARQLEQATGRDIRLEGDVGLALLPRPAASLGRLSIAGADGVEGPPLLTLDGLDAELALAPLLSGNIQVDRFVLRGLELALIVDEEGRTNWATAATPAAGGDGGDDGGDDGTAAPAPTGAPDSLPPVSLDDVRLVDAAVRYSDRARGIERAFEAIDGTVAMAGLDQPLTLDVTGTLDERPLELSGRLAALQPLLEGGGTGAELALAGDGLNLDFTGDVDGREPEADGDLALSVERAPSTLGWLADRDLALPAERLELTGALAASPSRVALDGLELGIDDVRGTGNAAVALDADRPKVTGRLDLGAVDLAAFGMGDDDREDGGATRAQSDGDAAGDRANGAEPWSRQPIGYTHPPVDLDVALSVESLSAPPLTFGAGTLDIEGDAERLAITLEELGFYDGAATGNVTLEPTDDGVALDQNVELADFQTGPLLADLAGTGFLAGRADLDLDVATRGESQHDLVAAAEGAGSFQVDRAVLRGLQGKPELEALRALLTLGGEPGEPLRIADVSGSVDLEEGVATNDDLVATTANLRLTGDGRIDLVNRRVPGYTLTPEATGALAGVEPLQAVIVPLIVEGPFDDLSVRPDPDAIGAGAVEEVERALEAAGDEASQGGLEDAAETIINEGLGGALERFGISP
ncbi:MAG: AsmA family protein [Alphaproteobacteria bacterium]